MTHSIEKTLIIAAPPAAVWRHLTQAEALAGWFHKPTADLAAGEAYEMPGEDGAPLVWGTVHTADATTHLAYSFTARPMGDLVTEVVWRLESVEAGTRLRLVHSGFPAGAAPFELLSAFDAGWDRHLGQLRTNSA
jgi:uncharacterized protein YndB with AHSA1/START domain